MPVIPSHATGPTSKLGCSLALRQSSLGFAPHFVSLSLGVLQLETIGRARASRFEVGPCVCENNANLFPATLQHFTPSLAASTNHGFI